MKSLLLLPLLVACSPHTVDAGTIGVEVVWGEVQPDALPEGLHWQTWFAENIINMEARVQKKQADASASSKDLQEVTTTIALNYRIDPTKAVTVFQTIGTLEQVEATIIDPALQEAVKTATARYNAEELITKRPEVKEAITEFVTGTLSRSHLIVTDLSIVNFSFDAKYQDAIEAKQVAEQKALTATNDLRRIEVEAQQAEARATGEANSSLINARAEAERQELLRRTITPELVEWEAIQKWNGVLPMVSGDGSAFVDISALARAK